MADLPKGDEVTPPESNGGEPEEPTGGEPKVEPAPAEEPEGGKAPEEEPAPTSDTDPEDPKKDRGQVRHERYIDKLSTEIRQANEQSPSDTSDVFKPSSYEPIKYKEGDSYDPAQIEEDRKKVADDQFARGVSTGLNQGSTQAQREIWADRFEIDSERMTTKYKDLDPDPDNADYDPKLESYLVQQYISFIGLVKDTQGRISIQKPNVRFKDFVEAEMNNLNDYAARKSASSVKNVNTQAAKTGMRPTGQTRSSTGGHGFDPQDPVGSVKKMSRKQYFELGGKEASDAYLAERGLAPKSS